MEGGTRRKSYVVLEKYYLCEEGFCVEELAQYGSSLGWSRFSTKVSEAYLQRQLCALFVVIFRWYQFRLCVLLPLRIVDCWHFIVFIYLH